MISNHSPHFAIIGAGTAGLATAILLAPPKIQSSILSLLPIPPIITKDQCEILSEADNVVSNNHMTLQDLNVKPSDVEEAMKKWLWRYKDGGEFAKV